MEFKKAIFANIIFLFSAAFVYAGEMSLLGRSLKDIEINLYSFGSGTKCIIIVGGMHGQYEDSTVKIAGEIIDWCVENEDKLDELNTTIKIVYNLNPDSFLYSRDEEITKNRSNKLRFNGNGVDINRNWNTPNWQRNVLYSDRELVKKAGGEYPQSEPETKYLAKLIEDSKKNYEALSVITLHSYVVHTSDHGSVFPSYIYEGEDIVVLPEADRLARVFAESGYFELSYQFEYYFIPGELLYWCGIKNISAIDIEFSNNEEYEINSTLFFEAFENLLAGNKIRQEDLLIDDANIKDANVDDDAIKIEMQNVLDK
ncbi:MAG: hypothetical protein Ta2G_07560 [Termitinemataceae bacterium]|nr:MAG: hypothetical protein Ta2G_07560 [Termitinemataceae bacterium]